MPRDPEPDEDVVHAMLDRGRRMEERHRLSGVPIRRLNDVDALAGSIMSKLREIHVASRQRETEDVLAVCEALGVGDISEAHLKVFQLQREAHNAATVGVEPFNELLQQIEQLYLEIV